MESRYISVIPIFCVQRGENPPDVSLFEQRSNLLWVACTLYVVSVKWLVKDLLVSVVDCDPS